MKLSRTAVALAAVLLTLPVLLLGTFPPQAKRVAIAAEKPEKPVANDELKEPAYRKLHHFGPYFSKRRQRDPNAPPWQPLPAPATISVDVAGVARDEARKAIIGARVTFYAMTDKGTKSLGTAVTDAEGLTSSSTPRSRSGPHSTVIRSGRKCRHTLCSL